jgi:hypothetical protein
LHGTLFSLVYCSCSIIQLTNNLTCNHKIIMEYFFLQEILVSYLGLLVNAIPITYIHHEHHITFIALMLKMS